MIQLTRQVRCFWPAEPDPSEASNRWVSVTPVQPLQPYRVMELTIQGKPCPVSGYIVNIREIDHWVHQALQSWLTGTTRRPVHSQSSQLAWEELQLWLDHLQGQVPQSPEVDWHLVRCRLQLSPQIWLDHNLSVESRNAIPQAETFQARKTTMSIELSQQFEFSAAHRLHCHQWSDQENARVFGKCNYPSGHGHNYLLDVTVSRSDRQNFSGSDVQWMSQWVQQHVIEKVDHRFLNHDVPEFSQLNPTVENICQVVFGWLSQELPAHMTLSRVRVYETAKTWADCFAAG